MPDIVRNLGSGLVYRMSGLADLETALNELTADLRNRIVRDGLRDAAKPIQAMARALAAPRDFSSSRRVAGTMRKAIKTFNSKRYKLANGAIGVYITVRASRAVKKARPVSGDPYYWRWVEGGHKIVARFKGKYTDFKQRGRGRLTGLSQRRRAATGMVKPYPFLGPAFRSKGEQARRTFTDAVVARIAKANAKK